MTGIRRLEEAFGILGYRALMSQRDASEILSERGEPITPSGVSMVEQGILRKLRDGLREFETGEKR